jgi:hypothetical protein
MNGPNICQNCVFWSSNNALNQNGRCVRHAPVPLLCGEMVVTCWPETNYRDFCGEFSASEAYAHNRTSANVGQAAQSCHGPMQNDANGVTPLAPAGNSEGRSEELCNQKIVPFKGPQDIKKD